MDRTDADETLAGINVQHVRVLALLPLGKGGGLLRLRVKNELQAAASAQVPEVVVVNFRVQRAVVEDLAEALFQHALPHVGDELRPALVNVVLLALVIDGLLPADKPGQIVRDFLGGLGGRERCGKQ